MPIDKAKIDPNVLVPLAREAKRRLLEEPETWSDYEIEQLRRQCGPEWSGMPLQNIRRQCCLIRKRGWLPTKNDNNHGARKVGIPPKEYLEYLKSDWWRTFRELVLSHWDYACALCNNTERLDVHHRTYERLGKENITDCVCLCRECHKMADRSRKREQEKIKAATLWDKNGHSPTP